MKPNQQGLLAGAGTIAYKESKSLTSLKLVLLLSLSFTLTTARITAQVSSNGSTQPASESVRVTGVSKPMVAGTISLASQAANYSKVATLNGTAGTGGNGKYTYQWARSDNSRGPFMAIPGATSVSYTAPVVRTTTYYRRIDSSDGATVTANMIIIKYDQGQ
jgi:hypothetical protein